MELFLLEKLRIRKKQMMKDRLISIVAPATTFLLLLLLWEFFVTSMQIPAWQLPKPTKVFASIFYDFDYFRPHIVRSYTTILAGFFCATILGITLAAFLNNFKFLGLVLTPYINMLCTTPVITLVPLLMLWLGFGQGVIILAVALQAFPILNMNAATGFNNVETLRLELMRSLRASRVQTFFHCILPSSLPSVFTGMKLSGIFATTACISSEFTGGSKGLGAQIIANTQFMKMDRAFACIFFVAFIGIFLYVMTGYLETKLVKWKA